MAGIKELKTRIKSIGSMRKVTRAMQMVSAAKMRKAQTAVLSSRDYSSLAWELISNVSGVIARSAPDEAILPNGKIASDALAMTQTFPNAKKIGVVVLGTNRGLVGSLNSNLGKMLADQNHEVISEAIVYGKKAKSIAQRTQTHILADFEKQEKILTSEDIYPLAKYITDSYITGEYKSIVIVYNHFVSTLMQRPTVKQLLPFGPTTPAPPPTPLLEKEGKLRKNAEPLPLTRGSAREAGEGVGASTDYLFEPTPTAVLEHLIPRIVESQIYQTILESDASEHSARMVMMKNATEAAGDLISDYTLTYNQLRQNKITTELAEITAGRIALE